MYINLIQGVQSISLSGIWNLLHIRMWNLLHSHSEIYCTYPSKKIYKKAKDYLPLTTTFSYIVLIIFADFMELLSINFPVFLSTSANA